MTDAKSDDLPPKEPALFALGVICQAWFLMQKPRKRVAFLKALRRLVAMYQSGENVSWRPDMSAAEVKRTSRTAANWLMRLAESLEKLAEQP